MFMKTITIELAADQIDELLDCEAINIGSVIFIKRPTVIEIMAAYKHKILNELKDK